eukprot:gene153-biopygen149
MEKGVSRPCSRVAFSVQRCARYVNHEGGTPAGVVSALKRIMRYLKGTRDSGPCPENERAFRATFQKIAQASGKDLKEFCGFSDADFAGCTQTLRSTSGSIMYYRGCAILWSSKRQSLITTSTCSAEYVAAFDTIQLSESQGYADWFGNKLPLIFVDSKSALAVADNPLPTKKSKHLAIRYHVVKEWVSSLCYVPTDDNRADPMTKPLTARQYVQMFYHRPTKKQIEEMEIDDEDDEELEATCRFCYVSL